MSQTPKEQRQSLRDWILLVVGIGFAANEIIIASHPRWEVLMLAAGMMGLAGALRLDERIGK